jgi:glycosyltransferase involved in cell wall biosynthesis
VSPPEPRAGAGRAPAGAAASPPPPAASAPDAPPPRILVNLSAFDGLASGARERALGLCGALLAAGCEVIAAEARGADLAAQVPVAPGAPPPTSRRLPLDPGRPLLRALRSERLFDRLLAEERPDLFLTDFHPVPVREGVRTVVTVHDLRDLAAPEGRRALRAAYLRLRYGRRLRRAHLVAFPSEHARREGVALLGLDEARTAVVPNGVPDFLRTAPSPRDASLARERLDLPRRPYLLALGVMEPRKNLRRLLDAVALLHAAGEPPPPLVLAGRGGPEEAALRRRAAALPAGAVRFAGYLRPADLPAAYLGARVLVHPALYEGFGMPVAEAMALGVPVACADAAALPETAGGAALLFDATDPAAIAEALRRATGDEALRADLARRGVARARNLTFAAAADALLRAAGLRVPSR